FFSDAVHADEATKAGRCNITSRRWQDQVFFLSDAVAKPPKQGPQCYAQSSDLHCGDFGLGERFDRCPSPTGYEAHWKVWRDEPLWCGVLEVASGLPMAPELRAEVYRMLRSKRPSWPQSPLTRPVHGRLAMVSLMAMLFQNGTVGSTGPAMWLPS
ncbi:FCPE, partial [Symbiodinium sp. CCMP2592]